jgi:hypothetical protein
MFQRLSNVFSLRKQHGREHGDPVPVPDRVGVAEAHDRGQAEDSEGLFFFEKEERRGEFFLSLFLELFASKKTLCDPKKKKTKTQQTHPIDCRDVDLPLKVL